MSHTVLNIFNQSSLSKLLAPPLIDFTFDPTALPAALYPEDVARNRQRITAPRERLKHLAEDATMSDAKNPNYRRVDIDTAWLEQVEEELRTELGKWREGEGLERVHVVVDMLDHLERPERGFGKRVGQPVDRDSPQLRFRPFSQQSVLVRPLRYPAPPPTTVRSARCSR
jgi:hypothetical protein